MPDKTPPHPGEILHRRYLEPRGISVTQAAEALDVSRKTVSAIVNGRAPVTADMALRLAAVFGGKPEPWVEAQAAYDLQQALAQLREMKRPRVKIIRFAAD